MAGWPSIDVPDDEAAELRGVYERVLAIRAEVTKALEEARDAKLVAKSQEAKVVVRVREEGDDGPLLAALRERPALADLFIVSDVGVESSGGADAGEDPSVEVEVEPADGEKCPRCWNFRTLGIDPEHADVCERCAGVLSGLE